MRSRRPALASSLLAAALLSNVVLSGCYSERLPPPTYRFSCGSNSDCDTGRGEACIDNLCQFPCRLATFSDDCPDGGNYVTCFNGVCSSLCNADAPVCPGVQSCLTFEGIDLSGSGGGGGLFGGGSSSSDTKLGLCGVECTEGSCPEGEVCVLGACTATCDPTADENTCSNGLVCSPLGVCAPDLDTTTGGNATTTDDSSTTDDSTTTDASTTTGTSDGSATMTGGSGGASSGGVL